MMIEDVVDEYGMEQQQTGLFVYPGPFPIERTSDLQTPEKAYRRQGALSFGNGSTPDVSGAWYYGRATW